MYMYADMNCLHNTGYLEYMPIGERRAALNELDEETIVGFSLLKMSENTEAQKGCIHLCFEQHCSISLSIPAKDRLLICSNSHQ